MLLKIEELHVTVEGEPILKGVNLALQPGEIHVLMGPNGAGKSTLAKVLAGHPSYEVTGGKIFFNGEDILGKEPEERAALGIFMSFQYPPDIPGVSTFHFLHQAVNQRRKDHPLSEESFAQLLEEKMQLVGMRPEFKHRFVNAGYSGGEKKRSEILQMALLEPTLAILDETDSGLDIDAMRIVASGVNSLLNSQRALLLITHYYRLLHYIQPTHVHILREGKIVRSGEGSLALELEEKGYEGIQ